MASDDESPGSPLSSIASDEFDGADDDDFQHNGHLRDDDTISVDSRSASTPRHSTMHPNKRRRTGTYDRALGTPLSVATGVDADDTLPLARAASPTDSISSDSSGDVPVSPTGPILRYDDDDGIGSGEQVTVCKWDACDAGDLGNMDALVTHLHEIHMPHRQKKYSCEWGDCQRKGHPQASGYALRAHMRSHTREKPFYCSLPECDRSFTRSDALAKHMRTVHETEALRPSDPIPKGHSGGPLGAGLGGNGNLKRIKLVFGSKDKSSPNITHNKDSRPGLSSSDLPALPPTKQTTSNGTTRETEVDIDSLPFALPVPKDYYPAELTSGPLALSPHELSLPPSQLYRLLRRQVHWAQEETEVLTRDLATLSSAPAYADLLDGLDLTDISTGQFSTTTPDTTSKSSQIRATAWKATQSLLEDIKFSEFISAKETAAREREARAAAEAAAAAEAEREAEARAKAEAEAEEVEAAAKLKKELDPDQDQDQDREEDDNDERNGENGNDNDNGGANGDGDDEEGEGVGDETTMMDLDQDQNGDELDPKPHVQIETRPISGTAVGDTVIAAPAVADTELSNGNAMEIEA